MTIFNFRIELNLFCLATIGFIITFSSILVNQKVYAVGEQDPLVKFNFENDTSGWAGIKSTKIELSSQSATDDGHSSLRTYGTAAGGTVLVSPWPGTTVQENALVQISLFIKADSCNANIYVKVVFLDSGRNALRSDISNAYDAVRCGTWQEISIGIQVPKHTATVYLAIVQEFGDDVDFFVDDVIIAYTDRISPLGPLAGTPIPANLQPYTGKHPRLFITDSKSIELRNKLRSPPYQALWSRLEAKVNAMPHAVEAFPPCSSAIEQRRLGHYLPNLAFAWLLSRDSVYLDAAAAIAEEMATAESWGACSAKNIDHVAGVVLFGLSVFYDWCFHQIDPELRQRIYNKITTVASILAGKLLSGSHADPWWKNAYLCNQMSVALAGLAAAGYATFDENEDGAAWIQLVLTKIENLLAVRAEDGTYTEGVGYWGYDLENLLKSLHLFQQLSGISFSENPWLKNTSMFRLNMGLPRNAWTRANQVVDFDNSARANWYGPDTILRCLAKSLQNPYAQWLAVELGQSNFTDDVAGWLNFICFADQPTAKAPADLPTSRLFPDIGLVSSRSDWSGDESLVVYSAGPPMGHKALSLPTSGKLFAAGHMHPDAGHFVVFACGEWQLRDDGYWADDGSENPKMTENHNTLVIDGLNQMQANEIFNRKAKPRIVETKFDDRFDFIASTLHEAYKSQAGLKKYVRYLIFLKPDILIVIDELELAAPRVLDLLFHPENEISRDGEAFIAQGKHSSLRISYFAQEGIQSFWGNERYSNGRLTMPTLRLRKVASDWKNATCISWSKSNPPAVTMQVIGDTWVFTDHDRAVVFDWRKKTAYLLSSPSAPTGFQVLR